MTDHWYIAKQARGHMKKYGPMSFQQLRNLAGAGKLQPTDLLCQEGMESWLPAKEVEGLFPRGGPALPPLPPTLEPAPQEVSLEPGTPSRWNPAPARVGPAQQFSWPLSTPQALGSKIGRAHV